MSDCGCDKARKDLEEYLRHEVCKTQHSDITEHLENCPACRDEALVATTLTVALVGGHGWRMPSTRRSTCKMPTSG